MKLFSTPTLVTIALTAALTSCSALTEMGDSMQGMAAAGAGGGGTNGGGGGSVDMVKSIGAANVMQLPANAAVGQSWTMDMSGMVTTTSIVAEDAGNLIVEQETSQFGDPIIIAYAVDPSVDFTEEVKTGETMHHNVRAAWVGTEGQAPEELKVMEAAKMPEMPKGTAAEVEIKKGQETVSIGGRDWDAEWSEVAGSKTWMAEGLLLKSTYGGDTTMQLKSWSTDAKPKLDWSAAE